MKTSKTYRLSKETLAKIGALQILFNGTTETQLAEKYFYEHRK